VKENKIFESTDNLNATLRSCVTSLWVRVGSARKMGWVRNEAVTFLYLVPYPNALMYSSQTQGSETFLIFASDQNLH
jgi:hypothetical protein